MAMFLSESINRHGPVLTMEEAHMGLLEAVETLADLTEATLRADFVVHERTRGLNESVVLAEEGGLLTRLATAVKNVLIKVRDAVLNFFRSLKEKLVALWERITGGGKGGSGAVITIPKNGRVALEKAEAALETVVDAVGSTETKPEKYKSAVEKSTKDAKKVIADLEKVIAATKASKAWEEVKVSELSKVQAFANRAGAISANVKADIDRDIKEAEKIEKTASAAVARLKAPEEGQEDKRTTKQKETHDEKQDQLKEAQDELQLLRARSSAYTQLASTAGQVSTLISQVISSRASVEAAGTARRPAAKPAANNASTAATEAPKASAKPSEWNDLSEYE